MRDCAATLQAPARVILDLVVLAIFTSVESSQVLFLIKYLVLHPSRSLIIIKDMIVNGSAPLAHKIIVTIHDLRCPLLISHLNYCLHLVKRTGRFFVRVFRGFL